MMLHHRAIALLASLTCGACGPDKNDPTGGLTEGSSSSTGPAGTPSTSATMDSDVANPTTTQTASTTESPTTAPAPATTTTTPETGSETSGSDGETGTSTTASSTLDTGDACGQIDLMSNYGAPCEVDGDCVALIGPDARCLKDILMVYALPGGYCSNDCALPPDGMTTHVKNAPDCFLGGDCVGLDGYFEACALECQCDDDCPRDGYECRRMPTISNEGDPKYCLMTDDNML
jgi:hypothetical protein